MTRRVRAALTLVAVVVAIAVMIRLSVWQWHRGQERGSFQNYSYAVEWLLFAVLSVVGIVRLAVEDRRRRSADAVPEPEEPGPPAVPGALVPLVGPPLRPGEELEEITWVRLCRRLGVGGGRP
jgi:hypothetical protein